MEQKNAQKIRRLAKQLGYHAEYMSRGWSQGWAFVDINANTYITDAQSRMSDKEALEWLTTE